MSQPRPHHSSGSSSSFTRINGKIRAREVRVLGDDNKQLGVFPLGDALRMARDRAVDLVEISPNANPPVCRLVDFGKYRYELAKKEKEQHKSQHANKVKEVQLSATIDPHDFKVKLSHAINFLCDDMKVKVSLRFRGREMAHQQIGMQRVEKFIQEIRPWGQPDFSPKLAGRNLHVMISPLPKNKRAAHPDGAEDKAQDESAGSSAPPPPPSQPAARQSNQSSAPVKVGRQAESGGAGRNEGFANNPFGNLEIQP